MSTKLPPSPRLAIDTLRAHRRGILAWILGGALAMVSIAAGFHSEAGRFEGGAKGMAESMQAGVQAMRLLRWPGDRLDTLGGYLTYHNVTLFVLFLTLYAAVNGVGAVRAAEAGHSVEVILATGRTRAQLVRARALGFALVSVTIGLGLGAGLASAMMLGGEPDVAGSFAIAFAAAACAIAGYGVGAVIGQIGGTARSSSAVSALIVVVLYLYTNVWDRFGPFGALRFVSPFYYFVRCRALVPGAGFDVLSLTALLLGAALLVGVAAWLSERRDVGRALWSRPERAAGSRVRVRHPVLNRLWSATLLRERTGLSVWAVSAAAALGLMAWLEPEVIDMWDKFDITTRMLQVDPGFSAGTQYLGFISEFTAPIVAGFVVTQAAGWVSDREEGRLAMVLSTPLSRTALLRQRLITLLAGAAIVVLAALAGLFIGARIVDVDLDAAGTIRVAASALLLAVGLGAVAVWLAMWIPRYAIAALSITLGASYLLVLLVPMFDWPSWIARLSLFGATGHPYLQMPAWGGTLFLAASAVVGFTLAATVAARAEAIA
ncbi:ABC transporter permease subunit [Nocardia aurantiaca]|uniref:ABC transporter permease subunit n=1 Tax=Nocardia aurantiaca TaxID=2675850 RepID=A0A6I3KU13_9NOCA|nr:ABC transporter permease subunit [Nocardia aurantiaca]MTE13462.1 ABC transporter permease subunit [Nocardia aurantiaca]